MRTFQANDLFIEDPPSKVVKELKSRLTIANPAYRAAMRFSPHEKCYLPETLCFLEDLGHNRYSIPRGFNLKKLPIKTYKLFKSAEHVDLRVGTRVEFPEPSLTPNKEQVKMLDAVKRELTKGSARNGCFLLQASTSAGKTIGQALIAAHLGYRTLVIFPTELIKSSWIDDLCKLFDLRKQDIGLIQAGKFKFGELFTLASSKTLVNREDRWDEICKAHGTVIIDETQGLPASSVYKFVRACNCRYLVGATADYRRADGMHAVTEMVIGSPISDQTVDKKETEHSMPISDAVEVITDFEYVYDRAVEVLDYNDLMQRLSCNDARNDIIVKQVKKNYQNKRIQLVTTVRMAHVYMLEMLIKKAIPKARVCCMTGEHDKKEIAKNRDRLFEGKIDIIVATVQFIGVGANINPVDTLIVATPVKDPRKFNQLLGRMRRKWVTKKDVIVQYISDRQTPYLYSLFKKTAVTAFRHMKIKRWVNMYLC